MQHYDVTSLLTICKILKGVQILEKFGWIWLFQQVQGYRGGGEEGEGGGMRGVSMCGRAEPTFPALPHISLPLMFSL